VGLEEGKLSCEKIGNKNGRRKKKKLEGLLLGLGKTKLQSCEHGGC